MPYDAGSGLGIRTSGAGHRMAWVLDGSTQISVPPLPRMGIQALIWRRWTCLMAREVDSGPRARSSVLPLPGPGYKGSRLRYWSWTANALSGQPTAMAQEDSIIGSATSGVGDTSAHLGHLRALIWAMAQEDSV